MASTVAKRLRAPALPPALRAELRWRPLWGLVVAGLLVRAGVLALYFPAVMMSFDTPRFARAVPGQTALFDDYWMPAGYPFFLKALHNVTDQVWFAIAVQHLIGVALAVLVFLALRRLGTPRWVAAIPTGALLFSGDVLYLEHILLADQFLMLFSALACCAALAGLVPRVDLRWLAFAGALGAGAMVSRTVGIAVIAALVVVAPFAATGTRRMRLAAPAAIVAGAAVLLGLYVAAFEFKNGRYLGMSDMSGWNLYARVAPFADCREFEPPEGTRVLCDRRPPSERPGPFGFSWDPNSVARQHFTPQDPTTAEPLGDFAVEALAAQPGDYAEAVLADLARYIEPSVGPDRGFSGQGRDLVSFGFRDMPTEEIVIRGLEPRYDGTKVSAPGKDFLATYQQVVRVDRLLVLALLLAAVAGVAAGRGPGRTGAAVFGLASLGLFVLPTLTLSYDFRYGIAPTMLLTVAGVLGAWALARRRAGADQLAGARSSSAR